MPLQPRPARPGKFPVLPFLLVSLALLAALLCWKGAVYTEARDLRQFLAEPAPAVAVAWWGAAGLCVVGVLLGIVWTRRSR